MSRKQDPVPITVLDATYVTTAEGKPPEFIGLWYATETRCHLLMFPLDRTDILHAANGDKGTLVHDGTQWLFIPRGN
jgi:hypothetical protein